MEYNNTIYLIGKNAKLIEKCLELQKEKDLKKIENFWNISSFEIDNNISKVFEEIIQTLEDKIEDYSDNIFSFTIIYSLDNLNEDKENIVNLGKKIVKINEQFLYQPFLILLTNSEIKNDILDKLINDEIKNIGYDIRNISRFMSFK